MNIWRPIFNETELEEHEKQLKQCEQEVEKCRKALKDLEDRVDQLRRTIFILKNN